LKHSNREEALESKDEGGRAARRCGDLAGTVFLHASSTLRFFSFILVCLRRRHFFCGHAVFFVSPAAKVYQLAAFGAERAVRVVLPLDEAITGRTLHKAKGKR